MESKGESDSSPGNRTDVLPASMCRCLPERMLTKPVIAAIDSSIVFDVFATPPCAYFTNFHQYLHYLNVVREDFYSDSHKAQKTVWPSWGRRTHFATPQTEDILVGRGLVDMSKRY